MEARSQRLPHCVGEGLGAVERLGRGTPGGLGEAGLGEEGRGWKVGMGGGTLGRGLGASEF